LVATKSCDWKNFNHYKVFDRKFLINAWLATEICFQSPFIMWVAWMLIKNFLCPSHLSRWMPMWHLTQNDHVTSILTTLTFANYLGSIDWVVLCNNNSLYQTLDLVDRLAWNENTMSIVWKLECSHLMSRHTSKLPFSQTIEAIHCALFLKGYMWTCLQALWERISTRKKNVCYAILKWLVPWMWTYQEGGVTKRCVRGFKIVHVS
jgi:hypothetical protein